VTQPLLRPLNPVLLLDVDGVINAVSPWPTRPAWPAPAWRQLTVRDIDGQSWPILTADPVLAYLRALDEAGAVEIRWHTTWQHSAVRCLAPALGLPEWAIADAPEFTHRADSGYATHARATRDHWWKAAAARRVVHEEGRRLIWIDDDLRWESQRDSALARLLEDERVLGLSPATDEGMGAAEVAAINTFLQAPRTI
jgi:hypothetical protein